MTVPQAAPEKGTRATPERRRVSRRVAIWALAAIGGALASWAVAYFVPGIWRSITDPPPVAVHVDPDPPVRLPSATEPSESLPGVSSEPDPRVFEQGEPDWTGYTYIIPRPIEEVGPPPRGECRDRRSWAHSLGGADAFFTRIQVTLEGRSPGEVLIDDMRVRVLKRKSPLDGAWIQCPVGGADVSVRGVFINLDTEPPEAGFTESVYDQPEVESSYAVKLSEREIETFYIEARANECYCEWVLDFRLVVGGERQIVTIDDGGEPFRTSAIGEATPYIWEDGGWQSGISGP